MPKEGGPDECNCRLFHNVLQGAQFLELHRGRVCASCRPYWLCWRAAAAWSEAQGMVEYNTLLPAAPTNLVLYRAYRHRSDDLLQARTGVLQVLIT